MIKTGYLLRLEGQGDLVMSVVTEEVWQWINRPTPRATIDENEEHGVPACVMAGVRADGDDGVLVTTGSAQNDRAMAAYSDDYGALKYIFGDPSEEDDFRADLKAEGWTILDEFDGYIY